ncbi:MAG: hypothetical protein FWF63_02575 [Fibromonadales bacterium]|nr:hypothetical protein [Fibromonadales bacterium]
MVLRFFFLAIIFLFISCSVPERDSPCDPYGNNYQGESYFLESQTKMENYVQVPSFKPLPIYALETATNARIVWGELFSEDGGIRRMQLFNAYGEVTKMNQTIIAGKRTPIYIAIGEWANQTYATFIYDNDPEFVEGKGYSLTITGGTGLKIFANATDQTPKSSGVLPYSGVDTLWIEGDFDIEDNKEFTLNVVEETSETPSLHITIRQPMLRFTDQSYANAVTPNGYDKWATGGRPPLVGSPLDVYIIVWDPARNEICTHCSFLLTQSASASAGCGLANPIVESDPMRMEGGKVATNLRGAEVTGPMECTATWNVYGPNKTATSAHWTGLRFRDAPVPIPVKSLIFDRNGDGIGDSVYIEFNRSFSAARKGDSLLPALLEVTWENGNTQYFYAPGPTPEQLKDRAYIASQYKDPSFFARNRQYWQQYIRNDSIIAIAGPTTRFSKDILTSGRGNVSSWIPFIDLENCIGGTCGDNALQYNATSSALLDRISPIVTKAEYVYAANNKTNCDANNNPGCREVLTVYLSEPVFAGPAATDINLVKNPFSYCFGRSQGTACPVTKIDTTLMRNLEWNNLDWSWELPQEQNYATNVTYKITHGLNVMAQPGSAKGDSVVEAVYYSYKLSDSRTRMPKSGDWVKIRPFGSGFVFQDAEGNGTNPRERGVLISKPNKYECRVIQ